MGCPWLCALLAGSLLGGVLVSVGRVHGCVPLAHDIHACPVTRVVSRTPMVDLMRPSSRGTSNLWSSGPRVILIDSGSRSGWHRWAPCRGACHELVSSSIRGLVVEPQVGRYWVKRALQMVAVVAGQTFVRRCTPCRGSLEVLSFRALCLYLRVCFAGSLRSRWWVNIEAR